MASFLILSILAFISITTIVVRGTLIDDECPIDDYAPTNYCRDCLSKNPGSANADLKGLANILLDCSIASAAGARDKAAAIGAGECVGNFNQARTSLVQARGQLQAGNARAAGASANKCIDGYWACLNRFGNDDRVPKELLPLMRKLKGECDAADDVVADLY